MAWTNVFDIGDCTLTVLKDGVEMTAGDMTAGGVSVAADAAGLVTLTAPAISSGGGSYEVRVTPAFDPEGAAVRLTAMAQDIAADNRFFPSWSPAPADPPFDGSRTTDATYEFTPAQAWTFAGAAIAQAGI